MIKKYIEHLDYGVSGRSVYSIGPIPELREGQSGWSNVDLNEAEIPMSVVKVIRDRGYLIVGC
jgi:hypothetical protein